MNIEGKRIGIYYRVSTDKQKTESQKHEVSNWINAAQSKGEPKSIDIFEDKASGKHGTKRKEFNRMLKKAYQGDIDLIVVYKLDRFSRSVRDTIYHITKLGDRGCGFFSVTQPFLNTAGNERMMILSIFACIAEMEQKNIVERIRAGLKKAQANGVKIGRPTAKIAEGTEEQILKLHATGMPLRKIQEALTTSKHPLSYSKICRILKAQKEETENAG